MDYTLRETLKVLGNSTTELTEENVCKIKVLFPVPTEHQVLWADVKIGTRASGLVLTDVGVFIKSDKKVIEETNATIEDKKDKVKSIYHYIKWEHFNIDDFLITKEDDVLCIKFHEKKVLEMSVINNFFVVYNITIRDIVKKSKNDDIDDTIDIFTGDYGFTDIVNESAVASMGAFTADAAEMRMNTSVNNVKSGHGIMAEEALNLLDKFSGKDATIVGRDNKKDGADRIVNSVEIQVKYHMSAADSIRSCFDSETGNFRYQGSNGKPMMIEVPREQYVEAIDAFRKKILDGKVPGVTNPDDASKYIKQGKLTYKQAVNLCKAGTVQSIKFDVLTGVVTCSFTFGLTFLATFIMGYAQTKDIDESLKIAAIAGFQVFGMALLSYVLSQQVARTAVTKQLIPLSMFLVKSLGYKATQTIVNSFRIVMGKTVISGAAASQQLAKLFRGNIIASSISFAIFSIPHTYEVLNKKLTTAQYTKNMLSLLGTMLAAGGGTLGATLLATKIGGIAGTAVTPGIGTAVGIAGGLIGGIAGGFAIKIAGDALHEDDSLRVSRFLNAVILNLIYEYLLTEDEIEVLIEKLNTITQKQFTKLFKTVIASQEQEKVLEDFVRGYFEEIIEGRVIAIEPTPTDLVEVIQHFTEE